MRYARIGEIGTSTLPFDNPTITFDIAKQPLCEATLARSGMSHRAAATMACARSCRPFPGLDSGPIRLVRVGSDVARRPDRGLELVEEHLPIRPVHLGDRLPPLTAPAPPIDGRL